GSCASNQTCAVHADDCVCFASGTCSTCLGAGAACVASQECCGQLHCLGGVCAITKGRRRHCTPHGHPCGTDGQCCGQGICYQGSCGEKDTHCHHNNECAKGYHCVGGRSVGDHRRCRKIGSHKHHRRPKK